MVIWGLDLWPWGTQMERGLEAKTRVSVFWGSELNLSPKTPKRRFLSMLQGQMLAAARAGIFASFQKGDVSVLICTDLASRGLDTSSVQLVVNYDFPNTLQDYLHRVGRVGRVGSKMPGAVVSFVTHRWDVDLVQKIETAARKRTSLPEL
uniref:Helicase C-terminal domain-containing protein n=1 Tax=Meleagris gallopavo TaxID=9103 RepID=G1MY30_MELGA